MNRHTVLLLSVLAAPATLAHAQNPPATDAPLPLVEAVVYSTIRPPNQDIYLYERRGEAPRRLTDNPALDYNAVFSPDGRWLVFTSERAGSGDLYALDLEGGGASVVRLTRHRAFDDAAAFSPEGERLAFVSTRDGDADIFVMPFAPEDPAGAERLALNLTRRPGGDLNPTFSPDGGRIAFSRQDTLWYPGDVFDPTAALPHTHTDVYVMNADGSNAVRLTAPGTMSGSPAWSENGELIYYYRLQDPQFFQGGAERSEGLEIRRMAADGTDDVSFAGFGFSPTPMPDGRIAFVRGRIGPSRFVGAGNGVVSVAADGSDLRVESASGHLCQAPAFDRTSRRMACHEPGPVEGMPRLRVEGGDLLLAPPGARRRVALPDRTLYVHGVLGIFPAVLPDGDIVSSFSLFGEPAALQLSRIDASDQRELFSMPEATVWAPTVARDAGWIVVSVGPPASPGADVDLWKLRVDGTDARNLTPDSSSTDSLASVSADGRRIVFRAMVPTADGGAAREIHVMDGDGGNRHRLDVGPGFATMPALSPDGEWVVYATTRAGRGVKLWIQPVDGGDGRLLEPERADIPDVSMHPRFSPDGQWVVFTSDRGHMNDEWLLSSVPQPYGDLYAVRVTGGPAVRLTDDKWEDGPNDWGFVRPIE